MVAFVPPSGNEKPLGPWTINKILLTRDRPEQFPPFFCMQFTMESKHYEMKLPFQSLSFSNIS